MKRFNQKIAKEIAQKQLTHTIDCVLGHSDSQYTLYDEDYHYEQNFEEDLRERGINPTQGKIESVTKQYQRMVDKAVKYLVKLQS